MKPGGLATMIYTYIYHAKSRLNTSVWGSLRSPKYIYELLTLYVTGLRSEEVSVMTYENIICSYIDPLSFKIGHFALYEILLNLEKSPFVLVLTTF